MNGLAPMFAQFLMCTEALILVPETEATLDSPDFKYMFEVCHAAG